MRIEYINYLIVAESSQNSDRRSRRLLHGLKIERHTTIFASMCPDEILDYYDDYETRSYYTTLMLGDVSGTFAIFITDFVFIIHFLITKN